VVGNTTDSYSNGIRVTYSISIANRYRRTYRTVYLGNERQMGRDTIRCHNINIHIKRIRIGGPMKEAHEPGRCYACKEDKPVRWKNIFTIGSEGTWLCLPCELKVVRLLEGLARDAAIKKKDSIIRRRMAKHARKRAGMKSWWIE